METAEICRSTANETSNILRDAENMVPAEVSADFSKDAYGFPFEPLDMGDESPLKFEEYASVLLDELSDIYYLTKVNNRFSPAYRETCDLLERMIRHLGSCCVTKAVLEQKGIRFENLAKLDIGSLYCCVSFNFRKCDEAVKEGKEKHIIDMQLVKMMCRLYELAQRLRSTAEKIERIRSGKLNADRLLEHACEPDTGRSGIESLRAGSPVIRNSPSFSIQKSYARELVREKRRQEREAAREERKREKAANTLLGGYGMARPYPAIPFPGQLAEEARMREEMIADAMKQRDTDKAAVIASENSAALRERWQKFRKAHGAMQGDPPAWSPAPPARSGPSDEVRKKLREKRKKKTKSG